MPRITRLPYGLSVPQRDCLVAAMRTGLLVPREGGRYRPWSALEPTPSYQPNLVATLVRRGLLERAGRMGARAAQPTRAGFVLAFTIASDAVALSRSRHRRAAQGPRAPGLAVRQARGEIR